MSAVSNCFQRRALEKVVLKRGLAGNGLTDGRLLFVRLCLSNSLTITSLGPALVRLWLFIFQVNSYKELKKKIVGHFKKHRRNCENCQSQVTWKVKFKWEFCPVLSWPHDHHDHHVYHDQHDHHDRGNHEVGSWKSYDEVGGCTQGSWRLSDLI